MKQLKNIFILLIIICGASAQAQEASGVFRAAGTPETPKVAISWNRYYNYEGITDICKKIAAAHPQLVKLSTIGKSSQGRDMWLLTITDFNKGKAESKPGFYLDGNIHSNEIQGTEMALYTAWYLTETFKDVAYIKEMLADRVFYIVPTINPDARDNYMKAPNNPNSPRSGMVPVDNDRDGKVNEDGFDDLDNDGHITQMIRKSPTGRFIKDPNYPGRLMQAKNDELGEYEILGYEGIDNDGDGRVNEDGEGFYDPNRDWGWKWQPNPIQGGAYKYPFSIIENRNVRDFVMAHPNIAGAQSFHNSGGMILRGPGAEEDASTYNAEDSRIYDAIGKKGEQMIPGYRYMIVYRDLYSVFGGELDWFYGGRGIYTFTNELFTSYLYFNRASSRGDNGAPEEPYEFNQSLLFGDALVPWKEYNHPQYGKIEVGGFKKNYTRADPGFLLESDAHRNMSFCLYHAYHMPKLSVEEISEKNLGNGLTEVTAVIKNERMMPTHASQDLKYKIERPDYISIEGASVVAGMVVENRDLNLTTEQKNNPAVLEVSNIPGLGSVTVRWIIKTAKSYTIKVDSRKGGTATKQK
ncbi:MAG: peptidase M14 [Cyclobacteriaceae bacterium]|nr:peptidase M14 [Cyclobacteriaceae bacterium]